MADSANLKRSKLSSSSDDSIDRISTLPDSLLSDILSFLPTKYAVRTSILSTRWKFLWTSSINLDFDDESFLRYKKNKGVDDRGDKMFTRFVYRVLRLLKPRSMHKFRLKCTLVGSHSYFDTNHWVSTAIERGVAELDLTVNSFYLDIHPLPRTLFNCKTLAVLKLDSSLNLNISTHLVSLPSLKILHLICVRYGDEESVHKLFRSCPVLEDLVIEGHDMDRVLTFNITSSSLITLKICYFGDDPYTRYVLQINTPALEYLDLTDGMSSQISLTNMVSLVEANIDACIWNNPGDGNGYEDLPNYDNILQELVEGLSNAKSLSLSRRTMEALSFASQLALPKFDNLIRLKVSFRNKSREWKPLSSLLANSVNLEELICN